MRSSKRIVLSILFLVIFLFGLVACSEAAKVNANLSKQADYFECERRETVDWAVSI